jgi:predicted DNA-binding transcriptional regulator AlpA
LPKRLAVIGHYCIANKEPKMKDPNQLLRINDVSDFTSLAVSTINLWVAQGKFPKPIALSVTIKVWRMKDLVTWIDQQVEGQKDAIESTLPKPELRLVNG